MKKKILIGSLLVLTLLLLMPSIPAIQQKSVEEGIKQDSQEKFSTITLNIIKELVRLDDIKFPLIYNFLCSYILLRIESFDKFFDFIMLFLPIGSPIFLLFFIWTFGRLDLFRDFLQIIADIRGWNWDLPDVLEYVPL